MSGPPGEREAPVDPTPAEEPSRVLTPARVLILAVLMVALQLAFRGWCGYRSGWVGDDFVMINRTYAPGGHSPVALLGSYSGHMMPGPLYVTWVLMQLAPYQFALPATVMLAMQALAAFGLVRFLVVAFGARAGILAPLLLYLLSPFTVQAGLWWAAGSQAFMMHAALAWSMSSQITYLRTGKRLSALIAVLWVLVGLVFFEKTLLVVGALAFLTVAYFTRGMAADRLRQIWKTYRFSVIANTLLAVSYLAVYLRFGLDFAPGTAAHQPLGALADVMVLRSWATGIFGGPLSWRHDPAGPVSFADPPALLVVASLACLILLARELHRTRTHALRSLWLPAYFLASNVLLVAAGRAVYIGPAIGYELRYLSEMAMVTAIALALATLPVVGAVELTQPRIAGLLDRPRLVVWACSVIAVLALASTIAYVRNWDSGRQASAAWTHRLFTDARDLPPGAHVVDSAAPPYVAWAIARPANMVSHLIRPLRDDVHFGGVASAGQLRLVNEKGHIVVAAISPLRWQSHVSARHHRCQYHVSTEPARITLTEPVLVPGLWVRMGYVATGDSAVTVSAGGAAHRTDVRAGFHELYFRAGSKPFDSVKIGGLLGGAELCTDDVVVGQPIPTEGM